MPGDDLWVTGTPGLAALGLAHLRGELVLAASHAGRCLDALHRPQPRVAFGLALRGLAGAMLDVSDGLLGDLGHILESSACGARIEAAALPLAELRAAGADEALARRCALSGGDDYELLFTAAAARRDAILALGHTLALPVARIGTLTAAPGRIVLREADGHEHAATPRGYDHFA